MHINTQIAGQLNITEAQVEKTISLLDEGATIPFISRYRKEQTGSLDEVMVADIRDAWDQYKELQKRKEAVLKSIREQDCLTSELEKLIRECPTMADLEDLYLPFKPKRKTRATKARDKGLEPLAKIIMKQKELNVPKRAEEFLNEEVPVVEEAINGALDIIAEWINENKRARNIVRRHFEREAVLFSRVVKGKKEEGEKYQDYFNWHELLKKAPSHRVLAMRRGEHEGVLKLTIEPEAEKVIEALDHLFLKGDFDVTELVSKAVRDAYKRLLQPSMENEFKALAKEKADEEAIKVFANNMRQLLMAAPLGPKPVMAIDPGYKTGCKVVCLDQYGNLRHNETIYPHPPQREKSKASKKLASLVNMFNIEAVAIGNGTASRETEAFVKNVKFDRELMVFVVSEAGASIYSASSVAREEFPDYDVTVRGAVSIGRRLMDPLAELVKIDPKSIGVGQYQYDVDQNKLKTSLDTTVESCVNAVGVNLNTASKYILHYVSGIGAALAEQIILHRKKINGFNSRQQLKEVPRLGEKAFEQAAGFLRIENASNPLDNSAVHPESYEIVRQMAADLNCQITDLINKPELREKVDLNNYVSGKVGLPTLNDIMTELAKPGRDPRQHVKVFEFDQSVRSIEDLKTGMVLPGIVTNITNFGAFVDIGIKQNGLVHISRLANEYVANPANVLSLHQHVKVRVMEVDQARGRIGLSIKDI